jgi:PBSX family phage terminase large subunit|uniref:Large terminase n=1 Tax=Siphoviridae sp. ctGyV19 TaxID=2826225 RepID=A0A8S5MUS0_9CAUD|nr:MAG TPA: large terminase [Siphoviridae sp. ctGyV19]
MPFSHKQMEFFQNANHRWNVKVGATRSGKTYMDYYVIPKRIRTRVGKEGLTFILGVSKGTIQRNIIEPLQRIWGMSLVGDINSQNISRMFGEDVYCLGAEKVSQVSKLRGSSIKYCYGDEIAEWNPDVFGMLKSRLDKPYSCFDGACNPEAPQHWFKVFLESDADIYCQKYEIFDNPFLDQKFVDALCDEYRGTVLYDRYIRGLWVAAQGSIYRLMCDAVSSLCTHNPYLIREKPKNIAEINIGIDFGGNKSGHAFVATAYTRGYQQIIALASERHMSQNGSIGPDELGKLFVDFCLKIINLYGFITHIYCDSAEQTLIAGLRSTARKNGLSWLRIENAMKTEINDRIRFTQRMLGQIRFFYMQNQCQSLVDAMTTALWNEKNLTVDERLDDGSSDIDTLDAFEYTFERDIARFIRYE